METAKWRSRAGGGERPDITEHSSSGCNAMASSIAASVVPSPSGSATNASASHTAQLPQVASADVLENAQAIDTTLGKQLH